MTLYPAWTQKEKHALLQYSSPQNGRTQEENNGQTHLTVAIVIFAALEAVNAVVNILPAAR